MRPCAICSTPTACFVIENEAEVPRCMSCHDALTNAATRAGVFETDPDDRRRQDARVRRMTTRRTPLSPGFRRQMARVQRARGLSRGKLEYSPARIGGFYRGS